MPFSFAVCGLLGLGKKKLVMETIRTNACLKQAALLAVGGVVAAEGTEQPPASIVPKLIRAGDVKKRRERSGENGRRGNFVGCGTVSQIRSRKAWKTWTLSIQKVYERSKGRRRPLRVSRHL